MGKGAASTSSLTLYHCGLGRRVSLATMAISRDGEALAVAHDGSHPQQEVTGANFAGPGIHIFNASNLEETWVFKVPDIRRTVTTLLVNESGRPQSLDRPAAASVSSISFTSDSSEIIVGLTDSR